MWGSGHSSPVQDQHASLLRKAKKLQATRWFRVRRQAKLLARFATSNPTVGLAEVLVWAEAPIRAAHLTTILDRSGPADPEVDRREVDEAQARWFAAGSEALRSSVQRALVDGRSVLTQFAGLRPHARNAAVVETLKYIPGWACTALSVQANFPLRAGLFDLVVIDDASQCSIADILPLAYRARRIMIVGDPNQLTPVNSLGRAALESIAVSVGSTPAQMHQTAVSIGEDSAFTAYSSRFPDNRFLLDEHYRCHPEIAEFFNTQFYGGALRVLTAVQSTTADTTPRGLSFVDVRGRTGRGEKGGAYNEPEAQAIVDWVQKHLNEAGTLGVVTPFAAQAAHVRRRLESILGPAVIEARNVTVGTAHRFQGDERDTVLLSLVLSDGANEKTARWVETQRNLVNVAVSRAKQSLVVFGDATVLRRYPVPTVHSLVSAAQHVGARVEPICSRAA